MPYGQIIEHSGPVALFGEWIESLLFGRTLLGRGITGILFLLAQAVVVGLIFIRKRVLSENTYIPCAVFITLGMNSPETFFYSTELISSFLLILMFNRILSEIEFNNERKGSLLVLGIYISLGSLTNLSLVLYLPVTALILFLYTRHNALQYLLLLTGFLLPHGLLVSWYYVLDRAPDLIEVYYAQAFQFESISNSMSGLGYLFIIPAAFFLLGLFTLSREARLTKYQNQIAQIIFILLVTGIVHFVFFTNHKPSNAIVLFIPLTFYISHLLIMIRRRRLAELAFSSFVIGSIAIGYLASTEILPAFTYSKWKVTTEIQQPKTIWNVSGPIDIYQTGSSGLIIDKSIQDAWLKKTNEYLIVERFHQLLLADPPDIILDPEHKTTDLIERMPDIKSGYVKTAEGYKRLTGNL